MSKTEEALRAEARALGFEDADTWPLLDLAVRVEIVRVTKAMKDLASDVDLSDEEVADQMREHAEELRRLLTPKH